VGSVESVDVTGTDDALRTLGCIISESVGSVESVDVTGTDDDDDDV
jgi:hypothetical protein